MFDTAERVEMIRLETADLPTVRVEQFDGLIVDFCRQRDIPVIVKGLRAVTDFDYELQMAQMNHSLAGVETLFMHTNPQYSFLSSSLVKEVAGAGGDVAHLVPPTVLERLAARRLD
jgi:pantetheine-phosphate adenylyltransferase